MFKFKNFYQSIFSIKNKDNRKVITLFGLKLKFKNKKHWAETENAIKIQNNYNLDQLINSEKVILFLIPNINHISGGVMSIFSLCEYSRSINKDYFCLISTFPGKLTYAKNELFNNNEKIYRWEQIVKNGKNIQELILHIPEYYSDDFYNDLKKDEILFLKNIPNLQINIMNQNIEIMPKPKDLKKLFKLTSNITQTLAHHRYATQEICDEWQIPTHLFSVLEVKKAKANMLRGGAYKPRTSPYAFQGLGRKGLEYLKEASIVADMPIVTEVVDTRDVYLVAEYADVLQVGARNMQNFSLLQEVGRCGKPVLLKRGLYATIEEWLNAAEYIMNEGNNKVILCERGIRTIETYTRNTLDVSAIASLKNLTHLPIIADPSHATGKIELIESMCLSSIIAGCDGLMLEVHVNPQKALCDAKQALSPAQFSEIMKKIDLTKNFYNTML